MSTQHSDRRVIVLQDCVSIADQQKVQTLLDPVGRRSATSAFGLMLEMRSDRR